MASETVRCVVARGARSVSWREERRTRGWVGVRRRARRVGPRLCQSIVREVERR